jgi:hypothetical protein
MNNLADYIYDLCQNSIHAKAKTITLTLSFSNVLMVIIQDDGFGMDQVTLDKVKKFEFTTNSHRRVGLGLSMIYDLVNQTEGSFELKSKEGLGTTLYLTFNHHHIDFPKFGNIGSIISDLYMYEPLTELKIYIKNGQFYMFDLKQILKQEKTVTIKKYIEENINQKLRNIGVDV